MKNPYKEEAIKRSSFDNESELQYETKSIDIEYANPDTQETEECICGNNAYYKASIGTYQCLKCRKILKNDNWI